MPILDEEKVSNDLKEAIIAYFEGGEFVDYLEVPIEVVVELLEDYIIDSIEDISELVGMQKEDEDDSNYGE